MVVRFPPRLPTGAHPLHTPLHCERLFFGWLLCGPLLIIGHPKATVYFIFLFFATQFAAPKRLYGVPPTRSAVIASLL
jgi:hypothetical protein